jgi:hypothetical protein
MSVKQKIRQGKAIHLKCGTPISLLPLGWFCTTCSSYIDKSIVVRIEDVDKLLDEAAKQVRLAFSEGVNEHGYHWHYDGPDYARGRCEQIIELYEQRTLPEILQKILAVLDGKEKATPT